MSIQKQEVIHSEGQCSSRHPFVLKLSATDVVYSGKLVTPSAKLLESLFTLIVRTSLQRDQLSKHGAVVLTGLRSLCATRQAAFLFQEAVVFGVRDLILNRYPEFFTRETFHGTRGVELGEDVSGPYELGTGMLQLQGIGASGLPFKPEWRTVKHLHLDSVFAWSLASLFYGDNVNVSGGYPMACNLAALAADLGLTAADLIKPVAETNGEGRVSYYGSLKPEYLMLALEEYTQCAYDIDLENDWSMMLYTNRLSQLTLHGATLVRAIDSSKTASRPLRLVAVGYRTIQQA